MNTYRVKVGPITGTSYREIHKNARRLYGQIILSTKRKPYIRSAYFKKDKVFLDIFWSHLNEKNRWDRLRRMRLLSCAIELIKKSRLEPISYSNPNKPSEILYRFSGINPSNELFIVQVKENKTTKKKWFISVFPA